MRRLESAIALRVGVVEDPLVVPQIGEVAAAIEHAFADLLDDAGVLVRKKEIAPLVVAEPAFCLREDVRGIAPDEVRRVAIRDDDAQIAAIHRGGDEPREMTALRLRPAVQQDEALPIRAAQQVIGVVFRVGMILDELTGLRELPVRDDELLSAGLQIHVRDAASLGGHVVEEAIPDAGIAVARATVSHAGEITRHGLLAIGAQRIDRAGDCALVARVHVEDVAHEAILLAIVPDDLRRRAGDPLQHAPLLPAPRARRAERDPFVLLVQVHHADFDHVIRRRRTVLEADLVTQHKTIIRRELQLVVVAEPMKPRAARDLADGRELHVVLPAQSRADGCGGERGEELAASGTAECVGIHREEIMARARLPSSIPRGVSR